MDPVIPPDDSRGRASRCFWRLSEYAGFGFRRVIAPATINRTNHKKRDWAKARNYFVLPVNPGLKAGAIVVPTI
jgi:hypothetical protein